MLKELISAVKNTFRPIFTHGLVFSEEPIFTNGGGQVKDDKVEVNETAKGKTILIKRRKRRATQQEKLAEQHRQYVEARLKPTEAPEATPAPSTPSRVVFRQQRPVITQGTGVRITLSTPRLPR